MKLIQLFFNPFSFIRSSMNKKTGPQKANPRVIEIITAADPEFESIGFNIRIYLLNPGDNINIKEIK